MTRFTVASDKLSDGPAFLRKLKTSAPVLISKGVYRASSSEHVPIM